MTRDPNRWEQLTVNFTVHSMEHEVKVRCTGSGMHVKAAGNQPPTAYPNSMDPDFQNQLREELSKLMGEVNRNLQRNGR